MEFLRCIRSNDINPAEYRSELMKEVCPAIAEVRDDPGKEAEYMTWWTKMMDIQYYAEKKGMEKGLEKGIQKGMKKGVKKGMKKGADRERASFLARTAATVREGTLTLQQASESFGFTEAEIRAAM